VLASFEVVSTVLEGVVELWVEVEEVGKVSVPPGGNDVLTPEPGGLV
jgi:hypothetical protein